MPTYLSIATMEGRAQAIASSTSQRLTKVKGLSGSCCEVFVAGYNSVIILWFML